MRMKTIVPHIILVLFACYIALPPLWVLRTSFVPDSVAYQPVLMPEFTWENYVKLFTEGTFARAYLNSFIASAGATILGLPLAAMTGYAFARYRTGGQISRFVVLATQMLPPVAIILPVFALFRMAGLTNSVTGLMIAYAAINLPFLTWILMGFFEGVPVELEWAAQVDGATVWEAFWKIVMPVSLPGIAAAAVLGFILAWNEFLFALILTGPTTATIPVALAGLQSSNGVQIAEISAGVIMGILPMLLASRFIQRYLVRGLTFGAVK
ncbi:carbohydrate ABC transporter permease [Dongia soli]|uniref:Maltose/maltodextrin transport system permease protein MalG n=1 Tax=Dongia soli TaxID=600628 RepID=A0ABU5EF22_9PROT|nr:carbohydrate ABC transporter permease [Dongia soli]MDY0884454.1 carbohydrate ABC transporter permease [Dongia soli]